jgi:hypothetical protein
MQQFNMTVVHVPGNWNNPADGISRLETDRLPIQEAQRLNSATITRASDEFSVTSRGTDTLEDIIVSSDVAVRCRPREINEGLSGSAKVLCTTYISFNQCPNRECCFLCNDHLVEEDDIAAQALVTSMSSETTDLTLTEELSVMDPEVEDDVSRFVCEGRCLRSVLTRNQTRQLSNEWKLKQATVLRPHEHQPSDDPNLEGEHGPLSALGKGRLSKTWQRNSVVPGEPCSAENVLLESPPISLENEVSLTDEIPRIGFKLKFDDVSQGTQTTPGDFRALKVDLPHLEDFKAIHNNEEGHHGLAHSYRKLIVKCGSLWAEDRATATKIRAELKIFIENCPICQKVRGLQEKVKCKHSFIISRPFLEASYDFIVFDKVDRNGNRYIIVVVDNFSKLVELKSAPTRGAQGVAIFLMEIKARFGPIHRLRSDREKAFTSDVITRLNTLAGTEMVQCVVYHPQANSICERQNQIIMVHLRALCYGAKLGSDSMYAWSDLLPFVYSIVNNTPKLPLAISPLSMVYGVFSNYDQPLLEPRPSDVRSNPVDYVEGLMEWQTRLINLAEDVQSKYYSRMVTHTTVHRTFQEGDFVLQAKSSTGIRGKLVTRWIGPRLVLSRRNNDSSHPVLDLLDLVTSKIFEASIEDCRLLKTGWFEEATMLQDLKQLAALDKEEYEVQAILDHRPPGPTRPQGTKPSDYWFKVKWSGFSEEENSWEPFSELKETTVLEEYLTQFPKLKLLS